MILFGAFWQSPLKLCQSLKNFCNSSPQVVELSLILLSAECSSQRCERCFGGCHPPLNKILLAQTAKSCFFGFFVHSPSPFPQGWCFGTLRFWVKKPTLIPPSTRGREAKTLMGGRNLGLCMGGCAWGLSCIFFGGGMARGQKNSQQSTSFVCHFAPFLLKQEQTFFKDLRYWQHY